MKITIKTKNLTLTEDWRLFIEEKITSLKKFLDVLPEVIIELEKETTHHRKGQIFSVKARIHLPDRNLIAFVKTDDLLAAVVKVKDELQQEIKKYKYKNISKNRRQQRRIKHVNII